MKRVIGYLRREKVFSISLIAAILSAFFVLPDAGYLAYIDWPVLMTLFSLMAVTSGLKIAGLFDRICGALTRRAGNLRRAALMMVLACFFLSMAITNDVALITLVPLALAVLAGAPAGTVIWVISLMTVAANLGSMATPIGNPQNLYLFSHYAMDAGTFLRAMLPLTALSLALVSLACLPLKRAPLAAPAAGNAASPMSRRMLALYGALFFVCLLSVFKALPKWTAFLAVLAALLIFDRRAVARVDYALLGTFACFFVFVGNLGRIPMISQALGAFLAGREKLVGVMASQVISNVPAALMLSGFTRDGAELMRGVNLGGLGTLVASLASLISFKLYMRGEGASAGRYLAVFTAMNAAFLAALYLASCIL